MSQLSVLERAFQLARTGAPRNVDELAKQLRKEGLEGVDMHLSGRSIRADLRRIIREARAKRP